MAAAVLCMVVRSQRPEMAGVCALAAGCMLLLGAVESIDSLRMYLEKVVQLAGLKPEYLSTLMKALGVCYVTEFAEETCADLGESGLAAKVALVGKLTVFAMAAPLIMELLETILALSP